MLYEVITRQDFRNRLLACDRATILRVAATYLTDERADSAIGILAGDELLTDAHPELEKISTRFERL